MDDLRVCGGLKQLFKFSGVYDVGVKGWRVLGQFPEKRLEISIGAARGLDYLHTGTKQSFIHRDVKTTNILLDEKWVSKILDFGLSKGGTSHSTTHVSTDVKGTFGYLDPDYFFTRRLTKKSDVFAFGVVLLEVLCGRPAVDAGLKYEQISLVRWAQQCIKKGRLGLVVDPSLAGQILPRCLRSFVEIASNCLRNRPEERATMDKVVASLELVLASQRKVRTEGIITKVFQSIELVPKSGPSIQLQGKDSSKSISKYSLRCFSDVEIQAATNDFNESHLISRGWRKKVYKGCIDGKTLVMIKRLQGLPTQELRKAKAEIEVQPLVHHPNIECLIGFCFKQHEAILVCEYMANGSLEDHLYGTENEFLPWKKRLEICIDVARGLQSLYAEPTGVAHINIKPSHILLDKKWTAKIADFALSRLLPAEMSDIAFNFKYSKLLAREIGISISSLHPVLTECVYTKVTQMYSFGALMLEVLCARKPSKFNNSRDTDPVSLVGRFNDSVELGITYEVIDEYVFRTIAPECLKEYVKIASSCVLEGNQQPSSMDDVLASFQSALQLQKAWENHKGFRLISANKSRWESRRL